MAAADPSFEQLLTYIKASRGFDFTGYKRASLVRRVERRMQVVQAQSYDEYMDRLQLEADEFTALFNTILINVTSFFRDPEAWALLQSQLVPQLLEHKGNAPIRIWSAGCASGEEAYSLAICFAEVMGADAFRQRVKIYATDVDNEALTQARTAGYGDKELEGISPDLVERYFDLSGQRRVFSKELRRCVIFGRNDLVQDAPISHIDLLTCRNTLMYLDADTQARVLRRLHYALEPGGLLFVGKAELLLSHDRFFSPVEGTRRFFRKVSSDPARDRALLLGRDDKSGDNADPQRVRQQAMLSAPTAQIALDTSGRLVMSNYRAEALFGLSPRHLGQRIADLELAARPVDLRPLLAQVSKERRTVWVRDVELARPGMETLWFDVQIVPLAGDQRQPLGLTVIFNDITMHRSLQSELEFAHNQLETVHEQLLSTNEELETTNEELQSTVEELETTNEELQSTVEELETMNEQLHSINDELASSNTELLDRASQVDELNDFMESILASLTVGVTVLDRDLKITAWNAPAQQLWGLPPDEAIGKQLVSLDIGLPMEQVKVMLDRMLDGRYDAHFAALVEAIDRRGRPIKVQVTVSPLARAEEGGPEVTGVILVMEEMTDGGSPG